METKKTTPRIRNVHVGPNRNGSVTVTWASGNESVVDLGGWIATGDAPLAPLKEFELFRTVRVAEHGAALAWGDDDSDLMIDAVHLGMLADEQQPFDRGHLVEWQIGANLSNNEAADFLDVSLSTFHAYKAGARIPGVVGMVCRAAQRDPILMQAHFRPRRTGRPRKEAHMADGTLIETGGERIE